jgi:hypothetical protein
MKKIFSIMMLCISIVLTHTAKADVCTNMYNNLYDYLQPKISEITWLDVNSLPDNNNCRFVIRYYPCNYDISNQLDNILPEAIRSLPQDCILVSKGRHHHTEGYCTLENIVAQCH